jgi:hypothetical protein
MSHRLVLVAVRVNGRNPRKGRRRLGGFRQVFVAFQTHGYADFGFCLSRSRTLRSRRGGPHHSQNMATAAYRHALSQRDLRRHTQRQLNLSAFGQRSTSEEENSARTEILREADARGRGSGLAQRKREQIRETLSDSAFNPNWRSGHGCVTSLSNPKRRRYFSARRAIREVPNELNWEPIPTHSEAWTWKRERKAGSGSECDPPVENSA